MATDKSYSFGSIHNKIDENNKIFNELVENLLTERLKKVYEKPKFTGGAIRQS